MTNMAPVFDANGLSTLPTTASWTWGAKICYYANRLFFSGPTRLVYNDSTSQAVDYSGVTYTGSGNLAITDPFVDPTCGSFAVDTGQVLWMDVLRGDLFLFTISGVEVVRQTGNWLLPFSRSVLFRSPVYPLSKPVLVDGSYFLFLAKDGIYRFDGTRYERVTRMSSERFASLGVTTADTGSFPWFSSHKRRVYFPTASSCGTIVFDVDREELHLFADAAVAASFDGILGGLEYNVSTSPYSGAIPELTTEAVCITDDAEIINLQRYEGDTDAATGALPVEWNWESNDFNMGDDVHEKTIDGVRIVYRVTSDSISTPDDRQTITVSISKDGLSSVADSVNFTLGGNNDGEVVSVDAPIGPITGRSFRLRMSDAGGTYNRHHPIKQVSIEYLDRSEGSRN